MCIHALADDPASEQPLESEKPRLVAIGRGGESLGPATAGDRSNPAFPRTARAVRGVLASTTVGLVVFVLGWLWWHRSHQSSVREHWAAVARGRDALRRGRPDLALQAVNDVRDEAPGSGEAMTVAGLALLRIGGVSRSPAGSRACVETSTESIRCGHDPRRIELRPGKRSPRNRSPPDGRSAPTAGVPSLAHHGQGSPRPRRLSQGDPGL